MMLVFLAVGAVVAADREESTLLFTDVCEAIGGDLPQLNGPPSKSEREAWFAQMKSCRSSTLKKIKYNSTFYDQPRLAWTQSAFAIPMVLRSL